MLAAEQRHRPDVPTDELLPWLLEASIKSAPTNQRLQESGKAFPQVEANIDNELEQALREASLPVDELCGAFAHVTLEDCYKQLQHRPSIPMLEQTVGKKPSQNGDQ